MSAVANAGYPHQALQLLNVAHKVYETLPARTLKRPRAVYDMEFRRLEKMLRADIAALEREPEPVEQTEP